MLSKIVLSAWSVLIEVSLWALVLVGAVAGFSAGGVLGGLAGLVGAFLVGSITTGALLVFDDIRKTLKVIEARRGD